jgi:queuine/archaeosine tRNA-ribosyltransferase
MYSFVPAAVNSLQPHGLGIYVKYSKNDSGRIIIKEDNFKYTWIVCPDREIVVTKNNYPIYYPMGENFDEYVDLNIYNDHVANSLEVDIYMINYSAYGKNSKLAPQGRRNGRNPNVKQQPFILADSGGFQLHSGVKEYIDPLDVITWYNENVDWGMVLDVPPCIHEDQYLKRAAVIQANNIKVMLDNKKPNVELINILQGGNHDQRMEFLKIVDNPAIDRLAVPAYRDSTISDTASILRLVTAKRKFKHYHILGVYNLLKLAPIIRIANQRGIPLVTSDASTPIQSAVNKIYHHQQSIFEPEKRLIIGNRENIPSVHNFLPCSCPVCSAVKYMGILGALDNQSISNLLSIHNIWEINRYTNMMNELAQTLSDADYKSVVKHQLKSRSSDTLLALDMISLYFKEPDAALRRYARYFSKNTAGLFSGNSGLFEDRVESIDKDANLFINAKVETLEEKRERLERTLARYEKSYKIKVKPEKVEKKKKHHKKHDTTEVSLSTKKKKGK